MTARVRAAPKADPDDVAAYLREMKSGHPDHLGSETGGLTHLAAVQAEPVAWLWPGRIPLRKLSLIDGDPGVGKSTVSWDMAARVSRGRGWPDGTSCKRANVLILTAEDGIADTVRPRIDLARGDPSRVWVLTHVGAADGARPPVLPADVPILTEIVTRRRVRLVVIDVLSAFLGADVNSHRDTDVRRALMRLHHMAEATGAAVVCLRHLNKESGNRSPVYRGGGSIGIIGQARAAHLAAIDPDDESQERRLFAPVKINLAAMPKALTYRLIDDAATGHPWVDWTGEDARSACDLLGPADMSREDREDLDEAAMFARSFLASRSTRRAQFKDIADAARKHGIAERTLKRARRRAGIEFIREGFQGGTHWTLPVVESEGPAPRRRRSSGPSGPGAGGVASMAPMKAGNTPATGHNGRQGASQA